MLVPLEFTADAAAAAAVDVRDGIRGEEATPLFDY